MKEKFAQIALCTAAALLISGCGGNDNSGELSYEQPLNTLRLAFNYGDEQSYLNVWLPQEKQRYTSDEGYSDGFLQRAFDREKYDGKLKLKLKNAETVSDEDLRALEADAFERYGTRLDFSKAMRVSAEFRVQKNTDLFSDPRELTVVRYENIWYLYGETIDSFAFAGS